MVALAKDLCANKYDSIDQMKAAWRQVVAVAKPKAVKTAAKPPPKPAAKPGKSAPPESAQPKAHHSEVSSHSGTD